MTGPNVEDLSQANFDGISSWDVQKLIGGGKGTSGKWEVSILSVWKAQSQHDPVKSEGQGIQDQATKDDKRY